MREFNSVRETRTVARGAEAVRQAPGQPWPKDHY